MDWGEHYQLALQALVDVTGYGDHNCSWSAVKIVVPVLDTMPAAGTLRAMTDGLPCPTDMVCPPPRVRLLRWTTKKIAPGPSGTNQIIGATSCGPVFGRGQLVAVPSSWRHRHIARRGRQVLPWARAKQALGGDSDVPGFTATSQLISSTPRHEEILTPRGLILTWETWGPEVRRLKLSLRGPRPEYFVRNFKQRGATGI